MPFRILDLPNELIREIIRALPFKTVFTIQHVNHRFHGLAQDLLYKRLGDITSDNSGGVCLTSLDALELLRLFNRKPYLVNRVQSMCINWDWESGCVPDLEDSRCLEDPMTEVDLAIWAREVKALELTEERFPYMPYLESGDYFYAGDRSTGFVDVALPLLLAKLVNLEVLECRGYAHGAFCFPSMWQTFKQPVFRNLQRLIWTDYDGMPCFPVVYIIPMIMVAPRLECVSTTGGIGSMGADDDVESIFFSDGRPGQMLLDALVAPGFQCNITSLEFIRANIQPKLFRWLLARTKKLQRFKYTVWDEEKFIGIPYRLILGEMMEALIEVRHTLQVLYLDVELRRRGYLADDLAVVENLSAQFESFEDFYQLRKMTVNFYQMVPLRTVLTPMAKPTILDRLPPNLEYFAFTDGVGRENIRMLYDVTLEEYHEEVTKNMLQVLQAKVEGERMQSLRSVVTPFPHDEDSRWELAEACRTGGVTCEFWDTASGVSGGDEL
ncbi:hypothetical protein BZA05DRAFT_400304 [Tricharina praecox]|uniref:uncharacterized protein n=1 Tax=Tricharina praecox TaxID=43433 RepID=UPI00221E5BF9|nr:uncharacterized protein BZA05DRAFT_400304 [Tricharina praecox]KAI5849932.1 hypothetical protein BZA05DRAFT_400304 [Tricharina praecox]